MKLLVRRALAFLVWSPVLLTITGCASQAEGERCDQDNGNADCEPGLICAQLQTPGNYVCCPLTPSTIFPACNGSTSGPRDSGTTSDGETRADGGAETGAPDATSDPGSEATEDRSTVDTRPDTSPDVSSDMSIADIRRDGAPADTQDAADDSRPTDDVAPDNTDDTTSVDAPSTDAPTDAPPDATGEASTDAPLDLLTPIDAADASDAADTAG